MHIYNSVTISLNGAPVQYQCSKHHQKKQSISYARSNYPGRQGRSRVCSRRALLLGYIRLFRGQKRMDLLSNLLYPAAVGIYRLAGRLAVYRASLGQKLPDSGSHICGL